MVKFFFICPIAHPQSVVQNLQYEGGCVNCLILPVHAPGGCRFNFHATNELGRTVDRDGPSFGAELELLLLFGDCTFYSVMELI